MFTPRMALVVATVLVLVPGASPVRADGSPFSRFELPDSWEARFWGDPAVASLLSLEPKALAALVPEQGGVTHCRCPKCGEAEGEDPLSWSMALPDKLVCRKCKAVLPDDSIPAKVEGKVPEEVVEVLPRRLHRYPYHTLAPSMANYADERVYLSAKRDGEAREFLSKAAVYAAVRHREQPPAAKDPRLAGLACTLLIRFAQVYPAYATRYDQPGRPKFFDRADLPPPYRRGYGTAKWDWSGALDVPMNLVVAYALLKDDPAMLKAGEALGVADPSRLIERDLLRATARFVRDQPEESSEMSILAYRGMLAVGRLLDDPELMHDGIGRLESFLARGFYHDGLWRLGDARSHGRVVQQMDGWMDRLLAGYSDPQGFIPPDGSNAIRGLTGAADLPMASLAREARQAAWSDNLTTGGPTSGDDVRLASWPAMPPQAEVRRPALLGGAGIVRLGVGQGEEALDLELRGLGDYGGRPSGRLSIRMAVGGRTVLGDLDDGSSPTSWGFENATASHNTVMVDGLNQRETFESLREPAAGADIVFFAADPDFQVACLEDRSAYPGSSKVYRQTIVAAAGVKTRYAVTVFEVGGGLQHDQMFHADDRLGPGSWKLGVPMQRMSESLLNPRVPFLSGARAEDGRWFVQAMGAFRDLMQAKVTAPTVAEFDPAEGPGVRLHLMEDFDSTMVLGKSPGATGPGRSSLIVRRRSDEGESLDTAFVTVFDPLGSSPSLRRVGRIATGPEVIALAIEASEGTEYLIINRKPGQASEITLPDGRALRTDGFVTRVTARETTLAGGSFAEVGAQRVDLERVGGTVIAAGRGREPGARGQFRVAERIAHPETFLGRTLLIRHGDGTSRGWTILNAENLDDGGARISVREEAGLRIDPTSDSARYERFPGTTAPGPHRYRVPRIARSRANPPR